MVAYTGVRGPFLESGAKEQQSTAFNPAWVFWAL